MKALIVLKSFIFTTNYSGISVIFNFTWNDKDDKETGG